MFDRTFSVACTYRMVYDVVIKFYVFALFGQDQVLWQDTVAGNGACVFSNFEGLYFSLSCLFVFHVCFKCQVL